MIRTRAALAALLVVSTVALAQAPANPPVRIRGTVEKLAGNNMTVRTANGQDLNIKLADNYGVMGVAKASRDDLASGKFIGTTTVGERDGAPRAPGTGRPRSRAAPAAAAAGPSTGPAPPARWRGASSAPGRAIRDRRAGAPRSPGARCGPAPIRPSCRALPCALLQSSYR